MQKVSIVSSVLQTVTGRSLHACGLPTANDLSPLAVIMCVISVFFTYLFFLQYKYVTVCVHRVL